MVLSILICLGVNLLGDYLILIIIISYLVLGIIPIIVIIKPKAIVLNKIIILFHLITLTSIDGGFP